MFSRPVSSWLKPVPTSSRLPTRPRISARPDVGAAIRVRIFRSVDFPAPLRPMTPSTWPSGTSNETSRSAQISDLGRLCSRPVSRFVACTIVSRSVPYAAWYSPRRYFFESAVDLDRDGHQIVSAKRGSDERKTARPTTKSATATRDADGELTQVGRGRVEHRPAPAGDHRGHRVEREDPLPLLRDLVDREHHAREQRQHLEEDRDHVAHVPVADVDRREQQAEPEHGHDREQDEEGRGQDLPAVRPRVVAGHQHEQDRQADHEVDERHA